MHPTNHPFFNRDHIEPGDLMPATPEPDDHLKPWTGPTQVVGTARPRVDAYERVSGDATYTHDVYFPDMLHAAILRCPHPHARVRSVDTARAEKMPGVRAILTPESPGADIGWYDRSGEAKSRLLDPVCRYDGEEVAAVAADTIHQAREALASIHVDYEVLPFVVDPSDALAEGAPLVWPEGNLEGEVVDEAIGDVTAGFAAADVIVEQSFSVGAHIHAPMESFGSVARWEGRKLTIWDSTQGVFAVMNKVAASLGIPMSDVRVLCPYIGGGFGGKLRVGKYTVLAALLARVTARPVRLFLAREETFTAVGNRPGAAMRLKAGARADGTLTALELHNVSSGGAYPGNRYLVLGQIFEAYRCKNIHAVEHWAFTNTGQARAMRAPGFPQGAFALEQVMDMLAEKLELDPIEFRRRNHAETSQLADGKPYTSKGLAACLDRGAEEFGWAAAKRRTRNQKAGRRRRGVGVGACTWWAGDGGPPSTAIVRVFVDSSVTLTTGASDIGTGTKTVAAMVVAEELGVPVDRVRVVHADTGVTPYHYSSGGSQTLPGAIPAVRSAAYQVRQILETWAREDLETTDVDLVDGVFRTQGGSETASKSFGDLLRERELRDVVGVGYRGKNPEDKVIRPFGAQFAEVEVDLDTGEVRVLRLLGAHDSGRVINRTTFDNQVRGGMTQGLGFGMTEHRVIDRHTGRTLTTNLHDYKVPTALDVPVELDSLPIDPGDTECNNLGAKGLGEPPVIPTGGAIANAVADAIGVRVTRAPIGPQSVLEALAGRSS